MKLKKLLKDSSGNTMVSVLIGFLLLLIIMAMLQQIVTYTYRMMERAENLRKQTDELLQVYYTEDTTVTETLESDVIPAGAAGTESFTLVNEANETDGFQLEIDLNMRYTDKLSIFYFGEKSLVTGTGGEGQP